MDLKVGDLVAFKKYEYMTDEERVGISGKYFPEFGKISEIYNSIGFKIEGEPYAFNQGSVDHIIVKGATGKINVGDEVLVKAKVLEVKGDNILVPWISKEDVVEVLERKEEHFIVQEDYYGMYVNGSGVLIADKRHAKVYNSRNEANEEATNMHLNAWEVIPYDD